MWMPRHIIGRLAHLNDGHVDIIPISAQVKDAAGFQV